MGRLKEELLVKMKEDFVQLIKKTANNPSEHDLVDYKTVWETTINNTIIPSDESEMEHRYRNKLNSATGYIQLILLQKERSKIPENILNYLKMIKCIWIY